VGFVDEYCEAYRDLFEDVRSFECFKYLHVGLISDLPRKSLPAIARQVGLSDSQRLHHFLTAARWQMSELQSRRLQLIQCLLGETPMVLIIDETGDRKKGKATDYVAKQYIGNLGKTANGIVSVNAYGVVDNLTYPLLFKVFKPQSRLQADDEYQTKIQLAVDILETLQGWGFNFKLVLADSFYGESSDFIRTLRRFQFPFIVAIRSNHGVLVPKGQRVRYNRFRAFEQPLAHRRPEKRFIREIIFGQRRSIRYFQITKGTEADAYADSWYIMTDVEGDILELPLLYSLRNWIEYGFKQVKNELGWVDFRVTNYTSIERWWEIIFCAYLMVSLHAQHFCWQALMPSSPTSESPLPLPFSQHPHWQYEGTWKSALNNLRLLLVPYLFYHRITSWLSLFPIPGMHRCCQKLMDYLNQFRSPPILLQVAAA
jgi:SRSO17 transposase